MALTGKSLFLYGFEIDASNSSLDFRAVSGGPILYATLTYGYYSLTGLMENIKSAMQAVDPTRVYTISANRTYNGGLENRVTITTNGVYLDLLFGTGPRIASSCASLIGFGATDRTGGLTYTGTSTAGIALVPDYIGYNFLPPETKKKIFGSVNVSASGMKESVVFSIQKFWQVEFRYEPEAKVMTEWPALWEWMIQQRMLEFTPSILVPGVFYEGTLESTQSDAKGLGYDMTEMLPQFPFNYQTGLLKFRQRNF